MIDKDFKRNFIKGSTASSIGTIASLLFLFLTVMFLTRFVSKTDFGIYALIIVVVNMFNLLSGLGLELTLVRNIANTNNEDRNKILFPILVIRGLGVLFFTLIFVFFSKYILALFDQSINLYTWHISGIFILSNFRDLFYNLLQGIKEFRKYAYVNAFSSLFRLLITILYHYTFGLDIEGLLYIEILATLQPLIHQLLVIPFNKILKIVVRKDVYREIIQFSIPLYFNNLIVFFKGRINFFIMAMYLTPVSLANFDVASKIPAALNKLFQSYIVVYFPNLSSLFLEGNNDGAVKVINKSLNLFSLLMVLLFMFCLIFSQEIVILLFSDKYTEIAFAFVLLIVNFFLGSVTSLFGYPIVSAGFPSIPAKVSGVSFIISISAGFIFIPIYGFMGAVISLLIMNSFAVIALYFYLLKLKLKPNMKKFYQYLALIAFSITIYSINFNNGLLVKIILTVILLGLLPVLYRELKTLISFITKNLFKTRN